MGAQRLLMDLRQLCYFIAAAEKCSMSAAAERCGVSQPTLSTAIRQLELDLAVPLFRRTPFGLQATEFAERLYRHVVPILRDATDGMQSLRLSASRLAPQRQPDGAPQFITDAVPDIRQLRYFLCAFQEQSVTRAAARLHIAQPALSARIKSLECSLGGKLFERTCRGLQPTDLGHQAYSIYEPIVRAVDATRSSIGPSQRIEPRILRIGFIAALDDENLLAKALTAAVSAWRERYADVELRVVEGGSSALLDWVSAGNVDVAFVGDMDGGAAFAS
jgi:DNA-binding transcriptional LysR family regulator